MTIRGKYLETLKAIGDWTTIFEWAVKFGDEHPDLLATAHEQAINQKTPSTGLREIAARMSSAISSGGFHGKVELDASEKPRRVRYLSEAETSEHIQKEIIEDTEPLNRAERIERDLSQLNKTELYRIDEIFDVTKALGRMFRLDFEVDHARALLNPENPGSHHPDNMQILTKAHNVRKGHSNWERFGFDEQVDYIKSVVKVQKIIEHKMEIDVSLIDNIIGRLKLVY